MKIAAGEVAELADAPDSKSGALHCACGFDPHLRHQRSSDRVQRPDLPGLSFIPDEATPLQSPAEEFLNILAGKDSSLPLDAASLELAALDHSPLDRRGTLALLDEWSRLLESRILPETTGPLFLDRLNHLLFEELGFSGDTEDYYDPANSCLDQVVARRRGIPITLSLTYMEIARRTGRIVEGVALPAHFLCRYVSEGVAVYIDAFNRGQLLTEEDCVEMISWTTEQPVDVDPSLFPPASPRVMLHRMLNNLRNAYMRRGQLADMMRIAEIQRVTLGS